MIDVLLPIRTPAPWLGDTLRGLLHQTMRSWRLICTVHGSTPQTEIALIRECIPHSLVLSIPDHFTLVQALNMGLKASDAEFIARIDADDVPLPNRLARQQEYLLQHRRAWLVTTSVDLINTEGETIGTGRRLPSGDIRRRLILKNIIAHSATMFRRLPVIENGGYCLQATHGEDYELWLRMGALGYELHWLNESLTRYRIHSDQVTARCAMDAIGRRCIRRRRTALAKELGRLRLSVAPINAAWSARQIMRSWTR